MVMLILCQAESTFSDDANFTWAPSVIYVPPVQDDLYIHVMGPSGHHILNQSVNCFSHKCIKIVIVCEETLMISLLLPLVFIFGYVVLDGQVFLSPAHAAPPLPGAGW